MYPSKTHHLTQKREEQTMAQLSGSAELHLLCRLYTAILHTN